MAPSADERAQSDEIRRRRFEELYRRHYGEVLAYARRRAHATAYDVVADTFLVAWRRFDDLPEEPLPWLIAVARNVLANQRRATANREDAASRLAAERAAIGEPREPADDERLRSALARLAETDREALLLVAWDGLSQRDAAAALGCSPVAFRIRVHRARKRLRAELERLEPPLRPLARRSPAEGDVRWAAGVTSARASCVPTRNLILGAATSTSAARRSSPRFSPRGPRRPSLRSVGARAGASDWQSRSRRSR